MLATTSYGYTKQVVKQPPNSEMAKDGEGLILMAEHQVNINCIQLDQTQLDN